MRIWLWFLGRERGGGTIAEATVELTAVETSCFFPPICECSRCTAQLQICCHCRRTIYETVGWSKQLWVWRWLTKITPKIVRGPFGIIKQQKCGFYLICWIWNTVLLAPIGTVQKSKCSFSYSYSYYHTLCKRLMWLYVYHKLNNVPSQSDNRHTLYSLPWELGGSVCVEGGQVWLQFKCSDHSIQNHSGLLRTDPHTPLGPLLTHTCIIHGSWI